MENLFWHIAKKISQFVSEWVKQFTMYQLNHNKILENYQKTEVKENMQVFKHEHSMDNC